MRPPLRQPVRRKNSFARQARAASSAGLTSAPARAPAAEFCLDLKCAPGNDARRNRTFSTGS